MDALAVAVAAANAAEDKKARDVVVLDLREITGITDYFVICTLDSSAQFAATSDWIQEKLEELGVRPLRIEGDKRSRWMLMDYGQVVIHLFYEEERNYYDLEGLWGDAARVDLTGARADNIIKVR